MASLKMYIKIILYRSSRLCSGIYSCIHITCMNLTTIKEKVYEHERELGGVYRKSWREEKEGGN